LRSPLTGPGCDGVPGGVRSEKASPVVDELARRPYAHLGFLDPATGAHTAHAVESSTTNTAAGCCAPGLPQACDIESPSTCAPCSLLPGEVQRGRSRRTLAVQSGRTARRRRRPSASRRRRRWGTGQARRGEQPAVAKDRRRPVHHRVSRGLLEVRPRLLPSMNRLGRGHSPEAHRANSPGSARPPGCWEGRPVDDAPPPRLAWPIRRRHDDRVAPGGRRASTTVEARRRLTR